MKVKILTCKNCHIYTMKSNCLKCKDKTIITKPAKFSLEDKYGKYRKLLRIKNEMGS